MEVEKRLIPLDASMEAHFRHTVAAVSHLMTGIGVHNDRLSQGQQAQPIRGPVVSQAAQALADARQYLAGQHAAAPTESSPVASEEVVEAAVRQHWAVRWGLVALDGTVYSWGYWAFSCAVRVFMVVHVVRMWAALMGTAPALTATSAMFSLAAGAAMGLRMHSVDAKLNGPRLPPEA